MKWTWNEFSFFSSLIIQNQNLRRKCLLILKMFNKWALKNTLFRRELRAHFWFLNLFDFWSLLSVTPINDDRSIQLLCVQKFHINQKVNWKSKLPLATTGQIAQFQSQWPIVLMPPCPAQNTYFWNKLAKLWIKFWEFMCLIQLLNLAS